MRALLLISVKLKEQSYQKLTDVIIPIIRTHRRYQKALDDALLEFKSLVNSPNSKHWDLISASGPQTSSSRNPDGQHHQTHQFLNGLSALDFTTVQVHRRKSKGGNVIRACCELEMDPDRIEVDDLRAVLQTAEIRALWDSLVDKATVIEIIDPQTRIVKTDFRLGWPAHPRDSITISKTYSDSDTVIDISTSLPRSADEPAYLRPSPPFVRSHIHLLAWCIQLPQCSTSRHLSQPRPSLVEQDDEERLGANPTDSVDRNLKPRSTKGRVTVFWKIDWKGAVFSTRHSQIASLISGFVDYVRAQSTQIPIVSYYGHAIDLGSVSFDKAQEELNIQYSILPEELLLEGEETDQGTVEKPKIPLSKFHRSVELKLPADQGWDVQVKIDDKIAEIGDQTFDFVAEKLPGSYRTALRISHAKIPEENQLMRVKVIVQRLAGGSLIRVNEKPVQPNILELTFNGSSLQILLDDTKSISNLSLSSQDSDDSKLVLDTASDVDPLDSNRSPTPIVCSKPVKAENSLRTAVIAPWLRRSYIYFSSILQEPEAKWRHVADARGVTVMQLRSIDPTLTVFRAEATFVGIGVWNVYSAIATAGARLCWDKNLSDAVLLEDLNDLSSLWHFKRKGSWPVAPRDSVLVTTTYKSPTAIHLFSVSTDDSNLFPTIQPPAPGVIRTRTEILGWSIELLSPTTTQITLIDQHDPMGWLPKSWTPSELISQIASVGEFALKSGGPPFLSRVTRAKVNLSKYEHDKGIFRAEYSASEEALSSRSTDPSCLSSFIFENSDSSLIECELRCDCETWASSLEIVVDPPPTKSTCLKRHKLSSGGGWWIMIEHEADLLRKEKARISIRRGSSVEGSKGSVLLNGSNMKIDTEELTAVETQNLLKRRRVKANLIPLDQYPLSGPRQWRGSHSGSDPSTRATTPLPDRGAPDESVASIPFPGTISACAPAQASSTDLSIPHLSPMTVALDSLAKLQIFHIEQGPDAMTPPLGWTLVSEKGTLSVYKKIVPSISHEFPIYRVDKVVQGVTAEELVSTLSAISLRPLWDERIDGASVLESYGRGCASHLLISKPSFPFNSRLLMVANVQAQVKIPSASITSTSSTVHFIASSSFTRPKGSLFHDKKINPHGLVEAKVLLEGWILETIDPYSSSSHEIPSTRCTFFNAIDYGGPLPTAINSMLNSNLPRTINGLEKVAKSRGPLPKLCFPVLGLGINGPLGTDGSSSDWRWKLTEPGHSSIAVTIDSTSNSVFNGVLLLRKGAHESFLASSPISGIGTNGPSSSNSQLRAEAVRQLGVVSPPPNNENGATNERRLVSNPDLKRKASAGQVKRGGAGTTLNSINANFIDVKPQELVISEIALDRKLFPNGCKVAFRSDFLKEGEFINLDSINEFAVLGDDEKFSQPPIEISFHEMPSPAVFAASLDPSAKRAHLLLRMTLPVGTVDYSPARDSTKVTSDAESSGITGWFKTLSKMDLLINLRIEPVENCDKNDTIETGKVNSSRSKIRSDEYEVFVNGQLKKIILLRDSQTELDRWEAGEYNSDPASLSR
ncbi:hypothetical protein BY996DRAFT_4578948 [Phakopsora pachyrhizi]|nr:hypothetical protein BY996DRAFT_4578948 [Phakopsora pachyrhizi]